MPVMNRAAWIISMVALNLSVYLWLNWHPLSPPHLLPLSWVDRETPFLLWTVWPYLLLLAVDAVLPILVVERQHFQSLLRAYWVATAANTLIWMIYPTTYPRPPLPLDSGVTQYLYQHLVAIDAPGNCFPSGHITVPFVACWAVSRQGSKWAPVCWTACALLAPTILTLKQHYFWDLLAGLATAALGIAVATRWPAPESATLGMQTATSDDA